MVKDKQLILDKIPHVDPYRFVDDILEISEDGIVGTYFLDSKSYFYNGHFPDETVTPGFVITEIMAQIGVLGLGIYLMKDDIDSVKAAFLTSADVKFHEVSFPNDKIKVVCKKIFFRLGKLKCSIKAYKEHDILLCSGIFSGIIKSK
jgi:3-hydroxyacyl-[acyl-carrier-protein] dehydratase